MSCKRMKPAKLPLTTTLIAFLVALTGVESNAGESAKQPAGEQKNQSYPTNKATAGERTGRAASAPAPPESGKQPDWSPLGISALTKEEKGDAYMFFSFRLIRTGW